MVLWRWYSNEAGQWLSQDPLGYVDSFNAYAFNKFDPVNFVDPWGLQSEEPFDPNSVVSKEVTWTEVSRPERIRNQARETQAETTERRQQGHAAQEPKSEPKTTPAQPRQQRQGQTPPSQPRPPPASPKKEPTFGDLMNNPCAMAANSKNCAREQNRVEYEPMTPQVGLVIMTYVSAAAASRAVTATAEAAVMAASRVPKALPTPRPPATLLVRQRLQIFLRPAAQPAPSDER